MRMISALIGTVVLAACSQQDPAPPSLPEPDLRLSIPVEIGKAYNRGGTRVPVKVMNLTGRNQRYIHIECGIYLNGQLIESAQQIWTDVPAGETVTGELLPDASRADRIDCRPTTG